MGITRRLIQAARIRPNCSFSSVVDEVKIVGKEIRKEKIDEQELRAIVCPPRNRRSQMLILRYVGEENPD